MLVVRADNGGARSDAVVIADVPLRHVDEMVIAEAQGGVGHADEAEIDTVDEYRRQRHRFVAGGIAGAQINEPVHLSTLLSISVIRTRGSSPFNGNAELQLKR